MRFDAFALRKYVGTRMRCTIIAQLDFTTSLTRSAYFSPNIEELLQGSIRDRAAPNQGSQIIWTA